MQRYIKIINSMINAKEDKDMNFFIKVLDDINEEKTTDYTAWFIQRVMSRYSAADIRNMWIVVNEI